MEQAYARALWKMVEGGMSAIDAVENLRAVLVKQGRLALLPRIARAFERIAAREQARRAITLSVVHEKNSREAMHEARGTLKELGIAERDVSVKVDDTLIGGWRLEGRGHLQDSSHKQQLLALYNQSIQ